MIQNPSSHPLVSSNEVFHPKEASAPWALPSRPAYYPPDDMHKLEPSIDQHSSLLVTVKDAAIEELLSGLPQTAEVLIKIGAVISCTYRLARRASAALHH